MKGSEQAVMPSGGAGPGVGPRGTRNLRQAGTRRGKQSLAKVCWWFKELITTFHGEAACNVALPELLWLQQL